MRYLDVFNRRGLLTTLRHRKYLWFEPEELVTDDVLKIASMHKDEIIQEIVSSAVPHDEGAIEIVPSYRFLWVATTLESFEEYDPRYGYEIGRDPVYRMLDAQYYAWLRHRMENVKKSHAVGDTDDQTFDVLRGRFNTIHDWAVMHIGEDTLRRAIRTTDTSRYIPPSDETVDAYHQMWAAARRENQRKKTNQTASRTTNPEVRKLEVLLSTRGYALIRTSIADVPLVILRDDTISLPAEHRSKVTFTVAECSHLIGSDSDAVKQIIDFKSIMGGRVVESKKIDGIDRASGASLDSQGSLFGNTDSRPNMKSVSPEATAKVDAIRDQAISLGWTQDSLYRNTGVQPFPYGQEYGLVCFVGPDCTIREITDRSIELTKTHVAKDGRLIRASTRYYNQDVNQPWVKKPDKAGVAN